MFQKMQKMTALLLSILMLAGVFANTAFAAAVDDGVKKGEFIFAPHTYTEGDLTDIYYYTDEVFSGSALDYNEHLATMSMILAAASISSQDPDASYDVKSRNLSHLLREWEFTGFDVNEYYMQRPGEQTMGVGMAYKIIGEGDDAYTLLAIVPRSAGYQKEWAGNFTVGIDGVHEGFATGRDIILEFAKAYVEENGADFVGDVKVWTVGYSRGAGVANLLAAYLDDNGSALGVDLKKENIFAYTFGTPSNVQYEDEDEKAALESNYLNIHNRYSEYDIVTYAPFKDWNFTYYGTTKLFDVDNAEKKAEMLKFLEKTNKTIYDIYTAEGSSADPDNFMPLMLQLNLTGGFGVNLVPADPSYGIPTNQKDFLESRITFLVNNLVPDRETYVEEGYQYALQRLTSLYFGLDAEQSALLFEGMSQDVAILAAVYYSYFVSDFYLNSAKALTFSAYILLDSLPMVEEYLAALDLTEASEISEWYVFAKEFIQTEEYAYIKTLLPLIANGVEILDSELLLIKETLKRFASGVTASILGSGVAALTIDEAEKAELMTIMTSEEVAGPLTEFLVYLLLGSDDTELKPFNPSNKNIALAVTFLANAGRYMRVHNNEIILSWLRTEDSYYTNEDWHIHETSVKYDENGHWYECECGYKEESCVHALSEWTTIPENDGEKDIVVRSCPCGYEETKEAPTVLTGSIEKPIGTMTVVLICVGSCSILAAVVLMAIILKKRKTQK